ncbi:transposase [Amycolatopsis sp. RM579]|uniref:Transposase n=1 Tax=Amycolatopsis pithecellobii TaxID=664692 RepID=A0A6N7YXH6_9PSEU|nr:transposase [Amycolatopsis pithecellobii]
MTPGKRGRKTGPSPVDRARTGSKHHVITEGGGLPPAVTVAGGNRHDVTQLLPLIESIPPVQGRRGRPRRRPDELYADRAHDSDKHRDLVRAKGIDPQFARKGTAPRRR